MEGVIEGREFTGRHREHRPCAASSDRTPKKAPGETVPGALFVREYLCGVEVSAPNSCFR